MKKLLLLVTLMSSAIALASPASANAVNAVSIANTTKSDSTVESTEINSGCFFTDSHSNIWEFVKIPSSNIDSNTGITAYKYSGETPSYVHEYGFMNSQGISNITYDDIINCKRIILEKNKSSEVVKKYDMYPDGCIDIIDATLMYQYYISTPYNFVSNGTKSMDSNTFWKIFEQKASTGENKITIVYGDVPASTTVDSTSTTANTTTSTTAGTSTSAKNTSTTAATSSSAKTISTTASTSTSVRTTSTTAATSTSVRTTSTTASTSTSVRTTSTTAATSTSVRTTSTTAGTSSSAKTISTTASTSTSVRTTSTTAATSTSVRTTSTTASTSTSVRTTSTTAATSTSVRTTSTTASTSTSVRTTSTTAATSTSVRTTSTTASTSTSVRTTSTTVATSTSTNTTSTITYYECEFDGEYYWNQEDEALGPDSGAEIYKFLMETIELYGFEHFKIVWSRELIPYAWVLPDTWTAYNMHTPGCFQVIPSSDMETICNYYTVHEKYFLWRPAWADYNNCPECSVQHYQIHNFTGISFVIDSFYQIIPTDENGNDILTLGSNIPKIVESFTS